VEVFVGLFGLVPASLDAAYWMLMGSTTLHRNFCLVADVLVDRLGLRDHTRAMYQLVYVITSVLAHVSAIKLGLQLHGRYGRSRL
jgi:hypothetical protein